MWSSRDLLPWLEALNSRIVLQETPHACLSVDLQCCPSQYDATFRENEEAREILESVASASVFLVFLASDRGNAQLQRVREAVEIFNLLAVVNNTKFVEIMASFMENDIQEGPYHLCPIWKFRLVGKLSGEDILATEESVTWGQLLGFPDDPWEYSSEFRDVMEQLMNMTDKTGDFWYSRSVVEWKTHHPAIPMRGLQRNPWGDSEPTSSTEEFARELGTRLSVDVPPVVHLSALSDVTGLLEEWGSEGYRRYQDYPVEDRAWTLRSNFAEPGVRGITAALARTDQASLDFRLDDRMTQANERGLAVANTGAFFSSLICGRSVCMFPGEEVIVRCGELGDIRQTSLGASDRTLAGFYSAVAMSTFDHFAVNNYIDQDGGHPGRLSRHLEQLQWQWLAYTFWSRASFATVQTMDLAITSLTTQDVVAAEVVVGIAFPEPAEEHNTLDSSESTQYGFILAQKGTQVRPRGLEDGDDTVLVLSGNYPFRVRYTSTAMDTIVHAVIPGYGICEVPLGDGVQLTPDSQLGSVPNTRSNETWLRLFVDELESAEVLTRLLALMGENLPTLWFDNTGRDLVTLDLNALALVCPRLVELTLSNVKVVVPEGGDALQKWPLEKLMIDGVVEGISACLSDPAFRMARELRTLQVNVPPGWIFYEENKHKLQKHDGDFLSVVKDKLPIQSKAAVISVWSREESISLEVKAIHRMDMNTLELIFKFAATPVRRSVQVGPGSASNVIL